MNVDQYVNKIVRRIQCSGAKKREIRKQLRADINLRLQQGEQPEDIIARMGSVREVADSFNENMSGRELKKYRQTTAFLIVIPIALILLGSAWYLYTLIPRSVDIETSGYFDKAQVEALMRRTVELIDAGEYDALQENAIVQMQTYLAPKEMERVKGLISGDWGGRQNFGSVYLTEIIQKKVHYVIGEFTVTYDNVNVVYRMTFDQDMRLAGLYIR